VGARFNAADAAQVVKSSCIDYYTEGLDWRSGWGLFVLPRLEDPKMRDIALLHPDLRPKARRLVELAAAQGITLIISQTLRTQSEQDALYAQGRTAPGQIVTNLKYPYSLHCWGVAFDIAVLIGGKATWGPALYDKVGPLGESLGLEWGGRWTSFVDRPHFQLPGYTAAGLKARYGSPEAFIKTWEVEDVAGFEGPARVTYKGRTLDAGILEGRTFVELRALAEMLGLTVSWDGATKTVQLI
jgi:hypothetical protein